MITAIPNQPISFIPSVLLVDCPDKRLPLIAKDDDILRFQVAIDAPTGPYAYGDAIRDWDATFDWGGPGAWVNVVGGGKCAIEPAAGGYIEPTTAPFTPTIGEVYTVTIQINSISGTSTFTMGGQSVVLSAPGAQSITITAATTDGPRITLDNGDSRICVGRIMIFVALGPGSGCVIEVEVVDAEADGVLYSFDSDSRPDLFVISGGIVGVTTGIAGVPDIGPGSCIFIRVTYSCGDDGGGALCSQPIRIDDDCKGTVVVRACLDHDSMGFAAPAIFEARLHASLVRPRWEHDSSEERWSDGTINRYYIDRQRIMDLMIQPVDESLHPFLAALCMFDHVYIDGSEYSVDADGYAPAYGDALTGTAAVALTVRPKRELMRRVTCEAPGPGCDPANDPPCSAPNVFVSYEYSDVDGGYIITVNVYSALGFLPDRVRMYVNGVLSDDIAWTSPSEYIFGPVAASSEVVIELTNRDEPACDWTTAITLPDCPGPRPLVNVEQYDYCETGLFEIVVDAYDDAPFRVAGLRITINGGTPYDELNGEGQYTIGPLNYGDVVGIVVLDDYVGCDFDLGTFQSECGPCDAYPAMPTMVDVDFIVTADQQAAIEGGSLTIGWSFLIQDLPNATPPGSTLWEQNTGNTAVYAGPGAGVGGSDWNITVNAPGTVINVLANAASDDYDKWWVVRGAGNGTALYPSGKMALQWLYPPRSNDDDTNPGSRFFDRSFQTDVRADSNNLTDCRKGQVQLSTDGETDWTDFGLFGELTGMTTGGSDEKDNVYSRVLWYGGPTGTTLQGASAVRYFPW